MEVDLNELRQAIPYFYYKINDYKTWASIGFSLANLGEQGRQLFLDISLNQEYKDSEQELNKEFSRLLFKNTGQTQIKTFFYYANLYGYKKETIKEKRIVELYHPKPLKEPKIDLELIKNKRHILQAFINVLNPIKETDKYFLFDRSLNLKVVNDSNIKGLDSIISKNGKVIYNLVSNKALFKPLLIKLTTENLNITIEEALKLLSEIGLLYREKQQLFINYKYNYLIPIYDSKGNIKTVQFLANYETRKIEDLKKYRYLKSVTGEKQSLFYYPIEFKDYSIKKPLFITEGITDCLSLQDPIFTKSEKNQVIALLSANFTIDQDRIKEIYNLKEFNIFLLIDEDQAGYKAIEKLRGYLKFTVLKYKKFAGSCGLNPDNINDANDILKALKRNKKL
jgi:hypothetical protein